MNKYQEALDRIKWVSTTDLVADFGDADVFECNVEDAYPDEIALLEEGIDRLKKLENGLHHSYRGRLECALDKATELLSKTLKCKLCPFSSPKCDCYSPDECQERIKDKLIESSSYRKV